MPENSDRDEIDDLLAELEEDALIDDIGSGHDVPDTGHLLADALQAYRDRGMQDRITTPPWTEHAEKPQPPRQHTAETRPAMATDQEVAATLNGILDSLPDTELADAKDTALEMTTQLNGAVDRISTFMGQVAATLAVSSDSTDINMNASSAMEFTSQAVGLLGQVSGLLDQATGSIAAAQNAGAAAVARRMGS